MSAKISDALASGNSEEIISMINANFTLDTVIQLSETFIKLPREHLVKTDVYASALVAAKGSGKVSMINVGDPGTPRYEEFDRVLNRYIYNALTSRLYETSTASIQSDNNYIVASIISGTAIRTGLCFSSAQIGEIAFGLHFSGSDYKLQWGSERYEINAVGACVHLVATGKEVYKGGLIEEAELKKRLGKIGKCIEHPAGKRMLEVCVS